ncbi:MAG: NUDIX hydrolase [Flammeovirgaceae bacterium]
MEAADYSFYTLADQLSMMHKVESVTGILLTGQQVLLLKRKETDRTYRGYCLVGGKVDAGESLEEALIREVNEEIGLQVTNCTYYETHENDRFIIHFFWIEVENLASIQLNLDEFDDYDFFNLNELPPETLPITKQVLLKLKP